MSDGGDIFGNASRYKLRQGRCARMEERAGGDADGAGQQEPVRDVTLAERAGEIREVIASAFGPGALQLVEEEARIYASKLELAARGELSHTDF